MAVEDESIQSQNPKSSIELLLVENNVDFESSKLSTDEEKITLKTPDPEKESVCQHLRNENDHNETTTTLNSTTFIERLSTLAKKFINFVWSNHDQGQPVSNRLNALSAFLTLACVILLCFYIVRSQATELSSSTGSNEDTDKYYRSIYADIPLPINMEEKGQTYKWNSIKRLFEFNKDKSRLHVHVGRKYPKHFPQQFMDLETHNKTLKISGRPSYCVKSDQNSPGNVVASQITHLHLSEMVDCYHYIKLILTQWSFPKVHHIKLHKMLIREEEFYALSKFIDKHNETLHRVEIDECFLCQSSICDAGLINFPDHDFQISITRHESPDLV